MRYEPGRYRGIVEDYGFYRSSAGQHFPTVFIDFDLIGHYDPKTGELGACPPGTRTFWRAITSKTYDWVLSVLKSVGYDRDELKYFNPEVPGAVDLFGREIDVGCYHETYEGTVRERWEIGRAPRTKLTLGELEELDAQFGKTLERKSGDGLPDADQPTVGDRGDVNP
jgi:hypothetical protein